jgi:hypothetical protein
MNQYLLGGVTVVVLCTIALFLVWYDRDPPDDDDDCWGV